MYLRYRYRSKLSWFFWFGLIHVMIRNLGIRESIFREDLSLYNCLQARRLLGRAALRHLDLQGGGEDGGRQTSAQGLGTFAMPAMCWDQRKREN